jgi:hypothetical protein
MDPKTNAAKNAKNTINLIKVGISSPSVGLFFAHLARNFKKLPASCLKQRPRALQQQDLTLNPTNGFKHVNG